MAGHQMCFHDPTVPLEPQETISRKQFLARMLTLFAVPAVVGQVMTSSYYYFLAGLPLWGRAWALLVLIVLFLAWKAWKFLPWAGILLFCLHTLAFASRLTLAVPSVAGLGALFLWLWLVQPKKDLPRE